MCSCGRELSVTDTRALGELGVGETGRNGSHSNADFLPRWYQDKFYLVKISARIS